MSRRFSKFSAAILLFFAVTLWWFLIPSNAESDKSEIHIADWLAIGPIESRLPIFHNTKNINGNQFDLKSLLAFEHFSVDKLWPGEGEVFQWDGSHSFRWTYLSTNPLGWIEFSTPNNDQPQMFYLSSFIEAKRWMKVKLSVSSDHLFQIFVDGQKIAEKNSSEQAKDDSTNVPAGKISKEIKLETGKHVLVVKLLMDPVNRSPFRLKATLQLQEPWSTSDVTVSNSPQRQKSITHLLDGPKLVSVSVSPDGELAAIKLRQSLPPSDDSESWIELRRTNDGKLVNTYRGGMQLGEVNWAPVGRKFSYTTSGKEGATLWIVDLDQGTATAIMEKVKDLGQHTWAPNGTFIIYSMIEKPDPDKSGLKKLEGMPDRQPGWRNRSFLYRLNVPQGTRQRLTSGLLSTELNSISPDSKKLLFSRSYEDFSERPYSKQEVFILDLTDMTVDTL